MLFQVFLTQDAADDLAELYHSIRKHDSAERALYVLDKIEEKVNSLSELPLRGSVPGELLSLGILEYRELFFKPYRLIYRVDDDSVYVLLIADGRRDMQALLTRRLLA